MQLSEASRLIPINLAGDFIPSRPSRATIWRWVLKGVRGHRLPSIVIGSRRYVTSESIEQWLQAINASDQQNQPVTQQRRLRQANSAYAALQQRISCQSK